MSKVKLTDDQVACLALMRARGLHWIAGATEREWSEGRTYYIDDRVNAKGIRRLFTKCNQQALQAQREESHV